MSDIMQQTNDTPIDKYSYSSIDTFCTCPLRYDLSYNKGLRSKKPAIALAMGSIAHKCLELLVQTKMGKVNYTIDELISILYNGWEEGKVSHDVSKNEDDTEKSKDEKLIGVNEIQTIFFDDFIEGEYSTKMITFKELLKTELFEDDWQPLATEQEFTFQFENKYLFHGFIDRIDINSKGDIRVIDYKSSKKTYDTDKLNNAKQMGVYKLACQQLYGKTPVEFIYHFVFLDEKQNALEGQYVDKIDSVIKKTMNAIEKSKQTASWKPKPSPLCYWCPFTGSSPLADEEFNGYCQYYSLWTPNHKTYTTNRVWKEPTSQDKKYEVDW